MIKVMQGTYNESVIMYGFGDNSSPITISGDTSNGGKPTMDGGGSLTMGIGIVESRNIIIENLKFINYTDEGVLVGFSSKITLKTSEFTANGRASIEPDYDGEGFGIQVSDSSSITIEASTFINNGPGAERRANNIMGTGIDTFEMKNSVIRGNTSSKNIGGGVLVEDGENVLVENNLIEQNDLDVSQDGWWDAGIWVDGGKNITVRGNTIKDNLGPGIEVSDEDLNYPTGYVVENNSITGNYFSLYTFNFGVCPRPASDILLWQNNSVVNNSYSGELLDEWELDSGQQILCSR